ncbi:hypothetical protein L1049_016070 [Liquidambar formosana]|uniref:DUF4283 domain-containing protein n=1 Tax=Liquidambar formosana TaxID=63359 RepID=A0AAP0X6J2_LIQFO
MQNLQGNRGRLTRQGWLTGVNMATVYNQCTRLSKCLLGSFVDHRSFTAAYIQEKISTIWHTREIVRVEKMDDLFIFIFEDTDDCPDILINNPCAIEGAFLVLQEWVPNLTPPNVHFTKTRIWLQIHGLPFELLRKEVAEELGAYAGHSSNHCGLSDNQVAAMVDQKLRSLQCFDGQVTMVTENLPMYARDLIAFSNDRRQQNTRIYCLPDDLDYWAPNSSSENGSILSGSGTSQEWDFVEPAFVPEVA